MRVIRCDSQHLAEAGRLFNEYRCFYGEADALPDATAFLLGNLERQASYIYLLQDDQGRMMAFAQLYPAICSLAMKPFYWLYDLYVDANFRKRGYARLLLNHIEVELRKEGAQRISLDTARSNREAQALYESLGYVQEREFLTYHRILDKMAIDAKDR